MEKLPVSQQALIKRINRKLKQDGQQLKKARGERWKSTTGDYFIVDINRNYIVETHIDLEKYGRKIGALEAYEGLNSN